MKCQQSDHARSLKKQNVPVIEIKDLYKSFEKNEVLKGLSPNKGENLYS
jgi:phospholipid/cholesterol/gamma-HCH transport system ATP-binding protein